MLLVTLSAASLAAAIPMDSPISTGSSAEQTGAIIAEFAGRKTRDARFMEWERYDVRFTNTGQAEDTVSVCPAEQRFFLKVPRRTTNPRPLEAYRGHAVALDGETWSFSCRESTLGAGESVTVSVYYRVLVDSWNRTWPRAALVRTSAGDYLVHDDRLEPIDEGVLAAPG